MGLNAVFVSLRMLHLLHVMFETNLPWPDISKVAFASKKSIFVSNQRLPSEVSHPGLSLRAWPDGRSIEFSCVTQWTLLIDPAINRLLLLLTARDI